MIVLIENKKNVLQRTDCKRIIKVYVDKHVAQCARGFRASFKRWTAAGTKDLSESLRVTTSCKHSSSGHSVTDLSCSMKSSITVHHCHHWWLSTSKLGVSYISNEMWHTMSDGGWVKQTQGFDSGGSFMMWNDIHV